MTTRAPYAGRWVALLGDKVIGQGGTPEQAIHAAQSVRYKEKPTIVYVPTSPPLKFPPLLKKVVAALPADIPVYLVGGAIRDALLDKEIHDLDFVLPSGALKISRRVADEIGAAFFPMDEETDTGRVIMIQPDGNRFMLDFTALRGPDLESDLTARDFTINAMAVDVRQPQALLDPLGGVADLCARQIRACSSTTFTDDPVRILRAIRQAAVFGFHILPETRKQMQAASRLLPRVSPERQRDELFRILDSPKPNASLRALEMLGVLPYLLPELPALKGVEQSPPHTVDVWTHTLHVMRNLEDLLVVLAPEYNPDKDARLAGANLALGEVVLRLGRYRRQLAEHLNTPLNADRPLRPLLFFAALYHDVSKPQTRTMDDQGRVHFYEHDQLGAEAVGKRAHALHLSNAEIERVRIIIRHHLRPILLEQDGQVPTQRAVYRFFRETGPAGVDVCLLALADFLGAYGAYLPQEKWSKHLDVIRCLLEAWWEHPEKSVSPPILINGNELIKTFNLPPGQQIGQLLEAIREAQATGQVHTKEEALALAANLLVANK